MFRNGCVIKKTAQLKQICCPPPLSNLKTHTRGEMAKNIQMLVKVKWNYEVKSVMIIYCNSFFLKCVCVGKRKGSIE